MKDNKTIFIKKRIDLDGAIEFIEPTDLTKFVREEDKRFAELYKFLLFVADELNYYNDYRSTAFGNPDYELKRGKVIGFLAAKRWTWSENGEQNNKIITIKTSNGRIVMQIEKPKLPVWEREARKENAQLRADFGINIGFGL